MTPVAPAKIHDDPLTREARARAVDMVFFGIGTFAAVWLAVQLAITTPTFSWWLVLGVIGIWLVLAYLALPRLNRILTSIYVPDYFIGRTRTSDGLLGDPLNLAFRGSGEQLATALGRAGWTRADPVTLASSVRIVRSVLLRQSYPEAPVSPLMLFGRVQDAAFQQEVHGNASQRHHVRFWRTPEGWPLPGGTRVDWLGAASYDRAVGLSLFTLQVTHKIDSDIDVERDHIVSSLTAAEPAVTVEVLSDFTTGYHARNGGGDTVRTDGDLPIIDVRAVQPESGAPTLLPEPVRAIPVQVWLPAVVFLLSAPFVIWGLLGSLPQGTSNRTITVITLIGTLTMAVSYLLLLRRSSRARRLILALTACTALTHVGGLIAASTNAEWLPHFFGGSVAALLLIALSSPGATEWTTGSGK